MSHKITEVISGAWVYVQLEWLQYLKYWFQNRAQWTSFFSEFSCYTHTWQWNSLLSSLYSIIATFLQVVSHAYDVSKLPLIHSTEGCTEAPNLENKLHLGSQCFKVPELRAGFKSLCCNAFRQCFTSTINDTKNQHDQNIQC